MGRLKSNSTSRPTILKRRTEKWTRDRAAANNELLFMSPPRLGTRGALASHLFRISSAVENVRDIDNVIFDPVDDLIVSFDESAMIKPRVLQQYFPSAQVGVSQQPFCLQQDSVANLSPLLS